MVAMTTASCHHSAGCTAGAEIVACAELQFAQRLIIITMRGPLTEPDGGQRWSADSGNGA